MWVLGRDTLTSQLLQSYVSVTGNVRAEEKAVSARTPALCPLAEMLLFSRRWLVIGGPLMAQLSLA